MLMRVVVTLCRAQQLLLEQYLPVSREMKWTSTIYTALISPSDQSDHEKWLEALEGAGQAPGLAEVMVERHLTAVVASPLPPACAHTKNETHVHDHSQLSI